MDIKWTDTLQAIGSIGSFGVAIFAFWIITIQLRQIIKSLESETHAKLYTLDFEIGRFLINQPELFKYFRGNVEIKDDDPNYYKAEEVAGLLASHMEHVLLQMNNLPDNIKPRWIDYMKDLYSTSPILRSHISSNPNWYSSKLHTTFNQNGFNSSQN